MPSFFTFIGKFTALPGRQRSHILAYFQRPWAKKGKMTHLSSLTEKPTPNVEVWVSWENA